MNKRSIAWLIHGFALLHLCVAVLCRVAGMSDTLLLTLLTMTLTVLICMREKLSLVFTAIAIVLVNIVGYFVGVGLAALFDIFMDGSLMEAGLATFITTELIGWGLWLAARSNFTKDRNKENELVSDKQLAVIIIAISLIYVIRVMLNLYATGESSRQEIIGNSLALLIFVADVAFISRYVTKTVAEEREKSDEAQQRYVKLKQHVNTLQDAVEHYRKTGEDEGLEQLLRSAPTQDTYKERFLVRVGDHIVPVESADVACFISESKCTYVVRFDGTRYVINPSLDEISDNLDPSVFFRTSRSAIVAKRAIRSAERQPNGKLILETTLPSSGSEPLEVSRARVDAFLAWLEK